VSFPFKIAEWQVDPRLIATQNAPDTITIDGANPTTVTENAASATRQRVFQTTFPSAGAHSLTIVAGIGFQVDALTTTQY